MPIDQFAMILDKAIKDGRNLDYFCFFCRSLWSSTSVHCMICGRCVEGFDHHCVFVNNCVGYKNHANFLLFLMLSLIYTIVLIANSSWTLYDKIYHCHENPENNFCKYDTWSWILFGACFVFLLISILQILPIFWQLFIQCKSICKKKRIDCTYQEFQSVFEDQMSTQVLSVPSFREPEQLKHTRSAVSK